MPNDHADMGARMSRRVVRTDLLRYFVTSVGLVMTLVFFLR